MSLQFVCIGERKPCSRCRQWLEVGDHAFYLRDDGGNVTVWCTGCDCRDVNEAADAELDAQAKADRAEVDLWDQMDAAWVRLLRPSLAGGLLNRDVNHVAEHVHAQTLGNLISLMVLA